VTNSKDKHQVQIIGLLYHCATISIVLGSLYGVGIFIEHASLRLPADKAIFTAVGTLDSYGLVAATALVVVHMLALLVISMWKSIGSAWGEKE
jgi:hypothetical protein